MWSSKWASHSIDCSPLITSLSIWARVLGIFSGVIMSPLKTPVRSIFFYDRMVERKAK